MSIVSVMLSNHLIFYHPLLLLSSLFPSIRVFSNESALLIHTTVYLNDPPTIGYLGCFQFVIMINIVMMIVSVIVQSLSCVKLFATPWTAAHQVSLSFISQSSLKLMSIELVMPSNHLILCHPLLLLPSIFPSIRVFSSESALHIRWPKYRGFSISVISVHSSICLFRLNSLRDSQGSKW